MKIYTENNKPDEVTKNYFIFKDNCDFVFVDNNEMGWNLGYMSSFDVDDNDTQSMLKKAIEGQNVQQDQGGFYQVKPSIRDYLLRDLSVEDLIKLNDAGLL